MSISLHSNQRTGQSSIEFLAMLSLGLLIFTAFYAFFADQQLTVQEQEFARKAASTADTAAFELDMALLQGDGYSRTFDLPETIGGDSYTITAENQSVRIRYNNQDFFGQTAVDTVDGDLAPGTNRVENRGGAIRVTQP